MGGVTGPIGIEDQPLRIDAADLLKEVVGEQGDLLVPIEATHPSGISAPGIVAERREEAPGPQEERGGAGKGRQPSSQGGKAVSEGPWEAISKSSQQRGHVATIP